MQYIKSEISDHLTKDSDKTKDSAYILRKGLIEN